MLNDDLGVKSAYKPHSSTGMIGAREAEQILGVSRAVLHKLAQDGRLRSKLRDKPGTKRERFFNRADLLQMKQDGTALKAPPRPAHVRRAWIRMFGPIPFGFTVIPRDGNHRNVEPKNLALAPLASRIRAIRNYGSPRRRKRGTKRFWTAQERGYVRKNFATMTNAQIAEQLGVTRVAVQAQAARMKLRRNLAVLAQHIRCARERGIGSESYDKFNDRILVKVSNTGKQSERWRPKHHVEWEKANHRPVPPGFRVVFRDNNRRNFAGANLELVTRDEVSARAFSKFLSYPAPLREAIRLNQKLKREVSQRRAGAPPAEATKRRAGRAGSKVVRWTPDMDRVIYQKYPTTPTPELAQSLGVSVLSLRCRARRLGVTLKPEIILKFATEKAARIKEQALGRRSHAQH